MDYAALKTEIQTDPQALGFAAMLAAGSDQPIADALNLVRAGAAYQVNREAITSALFISQMDPTEFAALTQAQLLRLEVILTGGTVDINDTRTQSNLLGIFPNPGTTKTNVAALLKRQGSRAEVVLGRGTVVTASDVGRALRGGT
jgi:hypothetical protein